MKTSLHRPTRRQTLLGAAGLAAFPATAPAHPHPDNPRRSALGEWRTLSALPFATQEIYPARHRTVAPGPTGKPVSTATIVTAGGFTPASGFSENISDRVWFYNPATDTWREGEPLPDPMHHVALVSNSGTIYAIGGFTASGADRWRMENRVMTLDGPDADAWYEATPLPFPQAEVVAAGLAGRIHVVGGRSPAGSRNSGWRDHIDTDKHFAYVAAADRWYERAPLPTPRNSAAGAVFGSALYVIGGRTVSGGNSDRVDVYDPQTDRWQRAAPLPKSKRGPVGRGGHAAATYNGHIYAFGGEWFGDDGGGVYSEVFEYDPLEDKWRSVAGMPRPRHGLGAVALEDGIYVLGGAREPAGNGTTGAVDRFVI